MKTEARNEDAKNLHKKETGEILRLINEEDKTVADAVGEALPEIEEAVNLFVKSFRNGGRVFYVGAGTSGRLGILDASEIPPTFGVSENRVVGLIAGGKEAITSAQEKTEDERSSGERLAEEKGIGKNDFVVGISASGRTPFVLGCLEYSSDRGASTASITNNRNAQVERTSDVTIVAETGPEIIAGSTRMKAGTAQKMILNMISTASMIRLGKVFDNLMVDVVPSNEKLKNRATGIVKTVTGMEEGRIEEKLKESEYEVKPAILSLVGNISVSVAREYLKKHEGYLDAALDDVEGAE